MTEGIEGPSPQYGTLTAAFDLEITGLSVTLNSISRNSYYGNEYSEVEGWSISNGWDLGYNDWCMGFVLHAPNGSSAILFPTQWLSQGDGATSYSNIEIVNSSATSSLANPGKTPIYIGSTNGLGLSCYNSYVNPGDIMHSPPVGQTGQ